MVRKNIGPGVVRLVGAFHRAHSGHFYGIRNGPLSTHLFETGYSVAAVVEFSPDVPSVLVVFSDPLLFYYSMHM